jgi:hypothetical protein
VQTDSFSPDFPFDDTNSGAVWLKKPLSENGTSQDLAGRLWWCIQKTNAVWTNLDEKAKNRNWMGYSRSLVICALVVICGALFVAFLPEFVAFGWHILHGNSVQFEAWEIPVPWGWKETKYENLIFVQKLEGWPQHGFVVSEVVLGNLHLPVGGVLEHERLKRVMIEQNADYRYISESQLDLDGETGFCFHFVRSDPTQRLLIDCSYPIHRLSIQYMGMKSRSRVLDSIVQNIRPSK